MGGMECRGFASIHRDFVRRKTKHLLDTPISQIRPTNFRDPAQRSPHLDSVCCCCLRQSPAQTGQCTAESITVPSQPARRILTVPAHATGEPSLFHQSCDWRAGNVKQTASQPSGDYWLNIFVLLATFIGMGVIARSRACCTPADVSDECYLCHRRRPLHHRHRFRLSD
jgi:hypothetical protein